METNRLASLRFLTRISAEEWKSEMENVSSRYHVIGAWIALLFDPLFGITDFLNIRENWKSLLIIRLTVSLLTGLTLIVRKKLSLPSYYLVLIPFLLISLQNAYTYWVIDDTHLIGHNLNYLALLIGASMFVMWNLRISLFVLLVSALATTVFITLNPLIGMEEFFVKGGLLLAVAGIFMVILINTRYDLTIREIRSRLALQLSNEEIQSQNRELKRQKELINNINENLESLVKHRTHELEKKNQALEEYAFINAHQLRAPVASILGLINLMNKVEHNDESRKVMDHLESSASRLEQVVNSITKAIEKGDRKN